jgi:alcohol dehydrogenase (cytochrome c)
MKRQLNWFIVLSMATATLAAQAPAGRDAFQSRCAVCHGADGNGGEHGPSILARIARTQSDQDLQAFLHDGVPLRGMPAFASMPEPEMNALIAFLRTLASPAPRGRGGRGGHAGFQVPMKVQMTDGTSLDGVYREATSQSDWPGFNGQFSGNRYTTMTQIDKSNVKRLVPKWVFPVPDAGRLQGTPAVVAGLMYIPNTNTVIALDAGTDARIWSFTRPPTQGVQGNARSLGNNRAVSIAGERLFMETDNAHLIALNRFTGQVLWETEMADWRQNYNGTGSVLAVENLVVAGTAGGEDGVRGFLAAWDQQTGKEVWRFWTVPAPGEKGSETWDGPNIDHGGGPTWLTGSYDAGTKTLYWPTGNAGPDFNGDNRKGDNLYTCSILALDVTTGKLKWYPDHAAR